MRERRGIGRDEPVCHGVWPHGYPHDEGIEVGWTDECPRSDELIDRTRRVSFRRVDAFFLTCASLSPSGSLYSCYRTARVPFSGVAGTTCAMLGSYLMLMRRIMRPARCSSQPDYRIAPWSQTPTAQVSGECPWWLLPSKQAASLPTEARVWERVRLISARGCWR